MTIEIDDSVISENLLPILYSHDRYIIAYGGRGSSKTETFYIKYLLELYQPYNFRLCYVNKEKANIRDQQYSGFKRVAKRLGLKDLKFYDGDYRIINELNGNMLIPKGMDDPEKTKGLDDITCIWWDEINKGTQEDFTTLNALLRTNNCEYLQFAISFNPVSEKHWLRSYFFDKDNQYKLDERFIKNSLLSHSTYKDNEFIDQQSYYDTLLMNCTGNINRMLVDIEGKWGVMQNDNPFFYAYKEYHFSQNTIANIESNYIDVSFDFNANPCCCVVGIQNIQKNTYYIIDALTANNNDVDGKSALRVLCAKFKHKYIDSGLFTSYQIRVTGDASGSNANADMANKLAYYATIMQELNISQNRIVKRPMNTMHEFNGQVINYFLFAIPQGKFINYSQLLNDDILTAFADEKNSLNKAKKENGLHILDAWRYLMDFWLCHFNNAYHNDFKLIKNNIDYNIKRTNLI